MVKCEERKRDERDRRDGRDQAEQKAQKEKRDKELRALRLFRDVLILKTFVGFGGVLHGILCDEPAFAWVNSVQDVLEIVFDRDLPDGDDVFTSLLLSYTHMEDQVSKSTSQQGFESLLDQSFRERLSAEERLALFTAYQHLNRFPGKEIFPHSNTAAKKNKAKSKAKKIACGPAQASEETRQPGGTGPSGPEQASEETRQPGGAGP